MPLQDATIPTIWYKAEHWAQPRIVPVEITAETRRTVTIRGRSYHKETEKCAFFPTWDEAHQYLTQAGEEEVRVLRLRLEHAKGRLGNILGMKPPPVR